MIFVYDFIFSWTVNCTYVNAVQRLTPAGVLGGKHSRTYFPKPLRRVSGVSVYSGLKQRRRPNACPEIPVWVLCRVWKKEEASGFGR